MGEQFLCSMFHMYKTNHEYLRGRVFLIIMSCVGEESEVC